jgi:phosphoglucomutase
LTVSTADSFSYRDPVDGSISHNQGLRIGFEGGGRAVLRLSGTGTEGATLRVYLEQYAGPDGDHTLSPETALAEVRNAVIAITQMQAHIGRTDPDVKT